MKLLYTIQMPVSHIFRRLQIQNDEAFIHHTNTDLQTGLQPLKIMEMFDLCGVQKLRFFSPANRPGISKLSAFVWCTKASSRQVDVLTIHNTLHTVLGRYIRRY